MGPFFRSFRWWATGRTGKIRSPTNIACDGLQEKFVVITNRSYAGGGRRAAASGGRWWTASAAGGPGSKFLCLWRSPSSTSPFPFPPHRIPRTPASAQHHLKQSKQPQADQQRRVWEDTKKWVSEIRMRLPYSLDQVLPLPPDSSMPAKPEPSGRAS